MSTPEQRMRRELERLQREHGAQDRVWGPAEYRSPGDRKVYKALTDVLSAADKCPRCGQSGVCQCP